ncbi:B-cell receptor CD22 isoform X1 [Pleuronectes platessa]|uniref:B-cell receptor CD22 isoform X1 n=1 Tax=Pleuronectes platessa TaxID=8262 RepID=UPI00232A2C46|nr:B-cell receptor CD22 isoform X1 [Pleuronectes platessa]
MEGSSVTLTCSSDANPAANYTWYKEDEDSPTASGQIFTITNITAEHGGKYQCEAQNTHGRSNTTLHLTVGAGKSVIIMNIIRYTLVVLLVPVLVWTLWTRMKKTLSLKSEVNEAVEMMEVRDSEAKRMTPYHCFHLTMLEKEIKHFLDQLLCLNLPQNVKGSFH